MFGTIDRKRTASAGAAGFALDVASVAQHIGSQDDRPFGHFGEHLSYLDRRGQGAKLLPALDPAMSLHQVRARSAQTCARS